MPETVARRGLAECVLKGRAKGLVTCMLQGDRYTYALHMCPRTGSAGSGLC